MILDNLNKEEVDVLYYALRRYAHDELNKGETFKRASDIAGLNNDTFVNGCLKRAQIATVLSERMIDLMLEDLLELKRAKDEQANS